MSNNILGKCFTLLLFYLFTFLPISAEDVKVSSPDGRLVVNVSCEGGRLYYDATLDGLRMLEKSALGLKTSIGDFTRELSTVNCKLSTVNSSYTMRGTKASSHTYKATKAVRSLTTTSPSATPSPVRSGRARNPSACASRASSAVSTSPTAPRPSSLPRSVQRPAGNRPSPATRKATLPMPRWTPPHNTATATSSPPCFIFRETRRQGDKEFKTNLPAQKAAQKVMSCARLCRLALPRTP